MENSPDQHKMASGPAMLPPGKVPPGQYYSAPHTVAAPRPGRFLILRRGLRLVLRRFLYVLVLLGRMLRPYAAALAIIMVLLGVIGWMGFQLWMPKSEAPQDTRVAALLPAPAVQSFIKGQQSYNADMMWSAYSTSYQSSELARGASKDTLQASADRERMSGLHYVKYDYVGGVQLDGGGGMYFYAVQLELQQQQAKLPMIFTVDTDGKIVKVLSPLTQ